VKEIGDEYTNSANPTLHENALMRREIEWGKKTDNIPGQILEEIR